uniref:Uncharacterized protein n=1 Tax=Anguilla anguilla TaxID=7936 RepID=A0A0E9S1L9_ANGAN
MVMEGWGLPGTKFCQMAGMRWQLLGRGWGIHAFQLCGLHHTYI